MKIVVLPQSQRPKHHPGESAPERLKRQVLEALYDRKPNEARNLIYRARQKIEKEPDADWAVELSRQADFAQKRLESAAAESRRAKRAERDKKKRVEARAKDLARQKARDAAREKSRLPKRACTRCSVDFTPSTARQRVCPSCTPPSGPSVRTVSGGLPTLGRGRR